jgi:hypothetical protein
LAVNVQAAQRCLSLAAEARGACVLKSEVSTGPGEGLEADVGLADGSEVAVYVKREAFRWIVSSRHGEWEAPDFPDNVLHAIACALGDPGAE